MALCTRWCIFEYNLMVWKSLAFYELWVRFRYPLFTSKQLSLQARRQLFFGLCCICSIVCYTKRWVRETLLMFCNGVWPVTVSWHHRTRSRRAYASPLASSENGLYPRGNALPSVQSCKPSKSGGVGRDELLLKLVIFHLLFHSRRRSTHWS